jgi:hypothetical protein
MNLQFRIRQSIRSFRRQRAFSLAVTAITALGAGGNAAVFAVVYRFCYAHCHSRIPSSWSSSRTRQARSIQVWFRQRCSSNGAIAPLRFRGWPRSCGGRAPATIRHTRLPPVGINLLLACVEAMSLGPWRKYGRFFGGMPLPVASTQASSGGSVMFWA